MREEIQVQFHLQLLEQKLIWCFFWASHLYSTPPKSQGYSLKNQRRHPQQKKATLPCRKWKKRGQDWYVWQRSHCPGNSIWFFHLQYNVYSPLSLQKLANAPDQCFSALATPGLHFPDFPSQHYCESKHCWELKSIHLGVAEVEKCCS